MPFQKEKLKRSVPYFLLWAATAALGVILDQITKSIAVGSLKGEGVKKFIPYVLDLVYVENRGAAWGMFADNRWVFMSISTVAVILMTGVLFVYAREHKMFCISLAMVISGGIGNMIDRVSNGYVVDFLRFAFYPDFPVFNVADIFVTCGCALLAIYVLFVDKTIFKEKKDGECDNAKDR